MLTAHRRFVDQQKGYYVGLITFCSLLILLIFAISNLLWNIKFRETDGAERKIWSREKNCVSKILKILLLGIVPEVPCLFKFKNESGDPLLNM